MHTTLMMVGWLFGGMTPLLAFPSGIFATVTVDENTRSGSMKISAPCPGFRVRSLHVQPTSVEEPAPDTNWPPRPKPVPPGATKLNPAGLGPWKASITINHDTGPHQLFVFGTGLQSATTDLGDFGKNAPLIQGSLSEVVTETNVGGRVVFSFHISGTCP